MKIPSDNSRMEVPNQSDPPMIKKQATRKLIAYCEEVGADVYISGAAGKNYLDLSLFEGSGISVESQEFHHPIYPQRYTPFISNMSSLDYILNTRISDSSQPNPVKCSRD